MCGFIIYNEIIEEGTGEYNSVMTNIRKDQIVSFSTQCDSKSYNSRNYKYVNCNVSFVLNGGILKHTEITIDKEDYSKYVNGADKTLKERRGFEDSFTLGSIDLLNVKINTYIRIKLMSEDDCALFTDKDFLKFLNV